MSQVDPTTAIGYVLKRTQAALRTAMDAALHDHDLSVPQWSCLEQLRARPGLTNAELARGTFVSRQAMHHLLGTLRTADLVQGDGAGRYERFSLTAVGEARLVNASTSAAAVEERMVAGLSPEDRRRLYADLAACADALDSPQRATTHANH